MTYRSRIEGWLSAAAALVWVSAAAGMGVGRRIGLDLAGTRDHVHLVLMLMLVP